MEGGYHGKQDEAGNVLVTGWAGCALDTTTEPTPGRTWEELAPS